MIRYVVRILTLLSSVVNLPLAAQKTGTVPPLTLDATDVFAAFRLPSLRDTPDGGLASVLSSIQVGSRAKMLGVTGMSAVNAWSSAAKLLQNEAAVSCSPPVILFTGSTVSELDALLASGCTSVAVTAHNLQLDRPIEVQRNGITLDLGDAVLTSRSGLPYALRIEGANGVAIKGGEFISGVAAILVAASTQVRIANVSIHDLSSDGIVVTGSTNVVITGNHIRGAGGAGIVLHRGTSLTAVEHNEITDNLGPSNVNAGILLSDREVNLAADPGAIFGPDGYWVISQPITGRLHPPHDNLVAFNHIARNASSGIYVDGGVRNTIVSNSIDGNAKEGLCLDNGATANVVASNSVSQNGNRWGEPDWVLKADYVLDAGRLTDGTAAKKVPGISLDNAIYNLVFANSVLHNFGGGIKIVRTGYFNVVGLNTLLCNNDGASSSFHFFGIELGAAHGDSTSDELDFTPSRGNIVFSNGIRGNHYAGIFFDAGSDLNNVFDNTIMDAENWALESVAVMANDSLNNLTNLPSRNIGSGIDPALLTIGRPVVDAPPPQ